jgi:GT2 family glycosyltransferase
LRVEISDVTVLVVPRDHFGHARASLENLRATVPEGARWVYVDAGSPRAVRRWLKAYSAADPHFTLLRHDGFLTPNQARNRGLAHCRTPWLVFVDNDVFGQPGWLEALIHCAEETDADAVTPIVCLGGELHKEVHLAGGYSRIEVIDGERRFVEKHGFGRKRLKKTLPKVEQGPVTITEFHCLLIRRDVVAKVEPLDERLLATREHLDFGLSLDQAGARRWFEPASVVTYLAPPPFRRGERRHFLMRWSDELCRESTDWFYDKWDVVRDEKYRNWNDVYLERRRRRAMEPWAGWLLALVGQERGDRWIRSLEARWVRRRIARWRASGRAPRA